MYCTLITGAIGSSKSETLLNIIEVLYKNPENRIYIFDSQSRSLAQFAETAERYCTDNNSAGVSDMIGKIVQMLNARQNAQNDACESSDFDAEKFILSENQICIFIDDIGEFVNNADNESRDMMNNIARLAKNLGVLFFAAGRLADVVKLADLEPLTSTIVKYQNGIGIGGTAADYSFFNNSLLFSVIKCLWILIVLKKFIKKCIEF